jgi:hypothetical protein
MKWLTKQRKVRLWTLYELDLNKSEELFDNEVPLLSSFEREQAFNLVMDDYSPTPLEIENEMKNAFAGKPVVFSEYAFDMFYYWRSIGWIPDPDQTIAVLMKWALGQPGHANAVGGLSV